MSANDEESLSMVSDTTNNSSFGERSFGSQDSKHIHLGLSM